MTKNDVIQAEPNNLKKKKKLTIWILSSVAVVIILTLVIATFLANKEYKQDVSEGWSQIIKQSETLTTKVDAIDGENGVRELITDLENIESVIENQSSTIDNLNSSKFYIVKNTQVSEALNKYKNYILSLQALAQDPVEFNDKEYDAIKEEVNGLESEVSNLINKTFISAQLPNKVYLIPDKFVKIRDDYQKQLELEKEQASAEQAQESKIAQDEAAVRRNVDKFMSAYIVGDKELIKRYMTDAYIEEFNFNDLDESARINYYPESFRITEITLKNDNEYEVKGIELMVSQYVQWDTGETITNKYTDEKTLKVKFETKYNVWLVDQVSYQ